MGSAAISHLKTTVSLPWLFLVLILMALPVFGQEVQNNNTWYARSDSDIVSDFSDL